MRENEGIPFSQIMLERYLLNELSSEDADRITETCKENEALCEYLEKIKQSNNQILSEYSVKRVTGSIKARLENSYKSRKTVNYFKPFAFSTVPVAIAVVLLVFVMPDMIKTKQQSFFKYDRLKGTDAKISLYRKTKQGHERLSDAANVSKGDLIQIGYQSMGMRYGVILSIDGRGELTLHFPYKQDEIPLLKGQTEHFLKNSYELDDAPEFERFIFIYSENAISVPLVIKAAKEMSKTKNVVNAALELPENMKQVSIILKKRVSK